MRSSIKDLLSSITNTFQKTLNTLLLSLWTRGRVVFSPKLEFSVYSQNGEDGVLQLILQKIGTTNKFCVEFGVENGKQCNTRYLIEQQGWKYLHMDGDSHDTLFSDVQKEFITAENIEKLFKKYNVPKEFDLLSIDIDYNDYWVWQAIKKYHPRIVVIEYNASISPSESKVVPYDPRAVWDGTSYFGASLLALSKLGARKGYTLVYCESSGTNAFFVRDDLVKSAFHLQTVAQLYKPPRYGEKKNGKYSGHRRSLKKMESLI